MRNIESEVGATDENNEAPKNIQPAGNNISRRESLKRMMLGVAGATVLGHSLESPAKGAELSIQEAEPSIIAMEKKLCRDLSAFLSATDAPVTAEPMGNDGVFIVQSYGEKIIIGYNLKLPGCENLKKQIGEVALRKSATDLSRAFYSADSSESNEKKLKDAEHGALLECDKAWQIIGEAQKFNGSKTDLNFVRQHLKSKVTNEMVVLDSGEYAMQCEDTDDKQRKSKKYKYLRFSPASKQEAKNKTEEEKKKEEAEKKEFRENFLACFGIHAKNGSVGISDIGNHGFLISQYDTSAIQQKIQLPLYAVVIPQEKITKANIELKKLADVAQKRKEEPLFHDILEVIKNAGKEYEYATADDPEISFIFKPESFEDGVETTKDGGYGRYIIPDKNTKKPRYYKLVPIKQNKAKNE